jgi:hypothetical protein
MGTGRMCELVHNPASLRPGQPRRQSRHARRSINQISFRSPAPVLASASNSLPVERRAGDPIEIGTERLRAMGVTLHLAFRLAAFPRRFLGECVRQLGACIPPPEPLVRGPSFVLNPGSPMTA